jgi:hypothetical protein
MAARGSEVNAKMKIAGSVSEKRKALRHVARSAEKSRLAAAERDASILEALELASMRQVAESAGLSPARIHQIRHGR